jgi:hypothetical protein
MTIFQASTEINLGNGKKALFWYDKWLDGVAPINTFTKRHILRRERLPRSFGIRIGYMQSAISPSDMSS